MLYYASVAAGPAYPEASDEDWARNDALTFATAAERARDETPAEDAIP